MSKVLLVFLGSGLGGAARHGVNVWSMRAFGTHFPAGTFIVNSVGGLLMRLVAGGFSFRAHLSFAHDARLFLVTGMLGGFTTFSAFSLDTIVLIERGDFGLAALYVAASVLLAGAALALGLFLVRSFA